MQEKRREQGGSGGGSRVCVEEGRRRIMGVRSIRNKEWQFKGKGYTLHVYKGTQFMCTRVHNSCVQG